jgi:hypothetical protein
LIGQWTEREKKLKTNPLEMSTHQNPTLDKPATLDGEK